MINLRAEIVAKGGEGGPRHDGAERRTVCRILSLYNLTPLLQKLREAGGKSGEKETRVFAKGNKRRRRRSKDEEGGGIGRIR